MHRSATPYRGGCTAVSSLPSTLLRAAPSPAVMASSLVLAPAALLMHVSGISAQSMAAVNGIVFEDANANGLQDEGEAGLANVVIRGLGRQARRIRSWRAAGGCESRQGRVVHESGTWISAA